jgi:hypothetical protein
MNYKLIFSRLGKISSIIVEEVELHQQKVVMHGVDPYEVPDSIEEDTTCVSSGLKVIYSHGGKSHLVSIHTTDEEKEKPQPKF